MKVLKYVLYFAPLAVFAAMVGVFLLKLGDDPSVLPSAMLDKPVPSFALVDLSGNSVTQSAFKSGEPMLMNVFASWCQPCWAEHDVITQLAQSGVPIVGWAYKDEADAIGRFLERLGNPYSAVILDEVGRAAIEFGVYGAPETYVIDANGTIRYRYVGTLSAEAAETQILPLLAALKGQS